MLPALRKPVFLLRKSSYLSSRLLTLSCNCLVQRKYRNIEEVAPESRKEEVAFPELRHLLKDSKLDTIKLKDGVLPNEVLVYRAPNGTRLAITYASIQALGLILLGMCGHYVYTYADDLLASFADIDVDPLPAAFCTCVFSLVVMLATRGILRRSPLRIYLNSETDNFTLVKLSSMLRKQRIHFSSPDVQFMGNDNYFLTLYKGNARIKNCYYYIDPECFSKPAYYNKLMGKSWEDTVLPRRTPSNEPFK